MYTHQTTGSNGTHSAVRHQQYSTHVVEGGAALHGLLFSVETINPATAAAMLERNTHNRRLQPAHVNRLANVMRRGEFKLNGAPIVFDSNGDMQDGQHRMHAIIKAGVALPMCVIRGVDPSAFPTQDQGKKRSIGDVFGIRGEVNTTVLATAARLIHDIETGSFRQDASVAQLESVLERHPGLRYWTSKFAANNKVKAIAGGSLVAVLTLGTEIHNISAGDHFMSRLGDGAGLDAGSPILLLRERLIDSRKSNRRFLRDTEAALIIKAWNAYIMGKPLKQLKHRHDEQFPVIK